MFVSKWDVDDTVVSEDAQRVIDGRLLSTSGSAGRYEDASVFTSEGTRCPETAGRVPERLPLGGEVAESCGDAEEESIVGGEELWGDDWVVWLGGSVHQTQDLFREGFRHPGGRGKL